jgi:hypothetical protein
MGHPWHRLLATRGILVPPAIRRNYCSYIQDSKLDGVIPSLGRKLYLVWNQVVAREEEEI